MKRSFLLLFLIFSVFMSFAQKIPFQGKLTADGVPVTGSRNFTFSISSIEWSETHEAVAILDGYYSVILGSQTTLPTGLFDNADEVQLSISVDGTSLSPVTLYAPLKSATIPRKVILDQAGDSDTAFHIEINGEINRGLQVDLKGGSSTYAIRGNSTSPAGDQVWRVGAAGSATGEGTGNHTGLFGQAWGSGQFNAGVEGRSGGAGNGATGVDVGSYNTGVVGDGFNNAWGNTGVTGRASGSVGVDNIGVVGISSVNDETQTIENKGMVARAEGPGINYGILSIANGGVENWAGVFEGDVNINGQLHVNGELFSGGGEGTGSIPDSIEAKDIRLLNSVGALRTHLNVFEPADAGSLLLYGGNDSTNVIMGSSGAGYSGYLAVHDSLGRRGAYLYSSPKGGGRLYMPSTAGSVYNWIGNNVSPDGSMNGSMQVASVAPDGSYQIGAGMSGGYYYMDMFDGSNFFSLIEMGLNDDGSGDNVPFFRLNSASRAQEGKGSVFSVNAMRDLAGNDPDGEAAEMFLWGSNTPNFQFGADLFNNTDLPTFSIYGSKTDGGGWFLSNIQAGAYENGSQDVGAMSMYNTIEGVANETLWLTSGGSASAGQLILRDSTATADLVSLYSDGQGGKLDLTNDSFTEVMSVGWFGINAGVNAYNDGFVLNHDSGFGSVFEMYSGGNNTISVIGNAGDINAAGQVSASILTSSDGTVQSSDARLKTNVKTLENALENTRKLRGVSYNWIDEKKADDDQVGVIAQEVEAVYPEFVHTDADGMKAVNYAQMVSVLIEAIKELDQQVAALQVENKELKAQISEASNDAAIEELKGEIENIKALLLKPSNHNSSVGSVNNQ